jgi:anti-sigma factor RsiW
MKPECAAFGELLSALADRELPEADRARVEAHAGSCAACRRMLERFRRLDAALAEAPEPPAVPAERWDRMLAEIRRAGRVRGAAVLRPAPSRPLRFLGFAAATAAAAAALLVVALVLPGRGRPGPDYSSAESVAVEPSGGGGGVMVWSAPEGGLRLVQVTMPSEPEPSGDEAGG